MLLKSVLLAFALSAPISYQGDTEPNSASAALPEPAPDVTVPAGLPLVGPLEHYGIVIPEDETLDYRVRVSIAFLEAAVGHVTQTAKVEPYSPSILVPAAASDEAAQRTASLQIHATGTYTLYSVDTTIESRHLPQEWPRVIYRTTSEGTSKRRRENMYGSRGGQPTLSYRKDTKTGAPAGTRIWRDPVEREMPADSLDMLTSVYLTRALVRDEIDEITYPIVDKDDIWRVTLTRGERRVLDLSCGRFDAVEILLHPEVWEDEEVDEEKVERFEGLFGLHGSIRIWVEAKSGVPLRIEGEVPVGPLTLGVEVELDAYAGTPPTFTPLEE